MIDSNNNDTEIVEDLSEEQALQLKMRDFACRSKGKAKTQRRETVDYSPSIMPMIERKSIDIESRNYSPSAYDTWRSEFKSKTNSFFPIDIRDKEHRDPEKIDLNVSRRKQYLHNVWKKHQNAVYGVDIEHFQLIVLQKLSD